MSPRFPVTVLCCAALLAGCGSTSQSTTRIANELLPASPIIPDSRVRIAAGLEPDIATLIVAAAVFYVIDPLAPNWTVEQRELAPGLFHLALRQKRFTTGGQGEAPQIVRRRATELALMSGAGGYQIVEYAESIDSETLGARRMTTAVVRLTAERAARIP